MSDNTPLFSGVIHWPQGINEQVFLDQYWQKKPLLIRQAFPAFETPLPADELAGLSLEPDTTGKLITCDEHGAYHLEHGPFDEARFATLSGNQWSLLVTDVDKHLPEFTAFIEPFRFIPDWRIDDLMISYAPEGASVGAHVDEYDVFLLQASGVRTWSIDARRDVDHQMRCDGDLKILADFQPDHTWDLVAGDMLYLPPNTAHHGIASSEDCTTWSVGFRAPRIPDLIARMAELISDRMAPVRYTDDALVPAKPGEICYASIQRFKTLWNKATQLDDEDFANLLGRWLTESGAPTTNIDVPNATSDQSPQTDDISMIKAPFSRFARISTSDQCATLFVDGESFACSPHFAEHICKSQYYVSLTVDQLTDDDRTALKALKNMGCLVSEY
ncbi:MAG: cupin domain-containing protein [Granulosicoccus sp.]